MNTDRAAARCQNFSKNVRRLRLEKGISQADIAKAAGISQGTWFQYENGNRIIRLDALLRISDYLQVPLMELIDGEKQQIVLSQEKQDFLRKYDQLDKRGKQTIMELMDWELRFSL